MNVTVKQKAMVGIKTTPQPPQLPPGQRMGKIIPQPPHPQSQPKTTRVGKPIKRRYCPGTKALCEIHKFQKSTELLVPKMAFLRIIRELLQHESMGYRIKVGAVLVLLKAAEAYLI